MNFDPGEFGKTVGTIFGGVIIGVGTVYAGWIQFRRKNGVQDAKASTDIESYQAYLSTIQGLQGDVERMRKTLLDNDTKWRADMDQLEVRLGAMSNQLDAGIARARKAEDDAARLRFQLRSAGMEPVV